MILMKLWIYKSSLKNFCNSFYIPLMNNLGNIFSFARDTETSGICVQIIVYFANLYTYSMPNSTRNTKEVI